MVKANELRIGNWVDAGQLGYAQVATIKPTTEGYSMPIPITPEILVACGFEKDSDQILCLKWPGSEAKFYWIDFIHVAVGYTPLFNAKHITSLHQLQNLFFCLSGEELNYKPLKL